MKLVSIWNPKGGQGKSLLALNLAAAAADIDLVPVVVCEDPQGTSTEFFQGGKLGFEVWKKIPAKKPEGVDLIIFDCQASNWSLPKTNLVVMPVKPIRSQFSTYAKAYKQAKDANKRIITVVSDANVNRKEEREAKKQLEQKGAFILSASSAFGHADAALTTIFDDRVKEVKTAYKVNERRKEVKAILAAILNSEEEA